MKKYLIKLLIVVFSIGFVSCESDVNNTSEPTSFNFKDLQQPPTKDPKLKFKGKFKRGRRWSKKHNVPPCTEGFGLCNIKFVIESDGETPNLGIIKNPNEDFMTFVFLEDQSISKGEIFISSEDDYFDFPKEIAQEIGEERITIIPDDYVTHVDSDFPFGYVTVNLVKY